MKFNWVVSDIEQRLEEVSLQDGANFKKKQMVYQNMLVDLNREFQKVMQRIDRDVFFDKLADFDTTSFVNPFFNLINYMATNLEEYELNLTSSSSEKKNPPHTIKLCRDFYKKNDKDSLVYFKKIINIPNVMHFMNEENNPFLGRSYILSSNEFYMLINGKSYLEDSLATIHETKHIEMAIKGYDSGITLYQELAPILYELYMIDYLSTIDDNRSEVMSLRMQNINKYVESIKAMNSQIELIKRLKSDNDSRYTYQNLYENYDLYYDEYNLSKIYDILENGFSQKEIGKIISFVVAIDIYLNSKISNVNNVLSCYMFGVYKMRPTIVDGVLEYITSMFKPYQSDKIYKKSKK